MKPKKNSQKNDVENDESFFSYKKRYNVDEL